ncbi:MAG TPA: cbb3-type cytochrome oxidase assembly protein CcoS [Puia sp.]|nr:cbb3-type cytochrome oxidase assembly protein CcoS [Puia sp.]
MSAIFVLLIASMSVSSVFLFAFIWSVRHRQFEDDFSPPVRILFDDGTMAARKEEEHHSSLQNKNAADPDRVEAHSEHLNKKNTYAG